MRYQPNSHDTPEGLRKAYDLECLLLGELRRLIEEPATECSRLSLLLILDRLLLILRRQVVVAGRSEYLWEVTDCCPHLHRQTEGLRRTSNSSLSDLAGVFDRIARDRPFVAIAQEVAASLRRWMRSRRRIRRNEGRLLQSALNVEVGGEG